MIDGFTPATSPLEDVAQQHPCREIARTLALQGHTTTQLADALGVSEMTAWWLSGYTAAYTLPPEKPRPGRRPGSMVCISDGLVLEARRLYDRGLSMRQVAVIVMPQTTYSSLRSCAQSLFEQFEIRGWPRRDRTLATAKSNTERGDIRSGEDEHARRRRQRHEREGSQPMCGGTIRGCGKRRGQACLHRAMKGDDFCVAHSPAREAERDAHLVAARARQRA